MQSFIIGNQVGWIKAEPNPPIRYADQPNYCWKTEEAWAQYGNVSR